MAYARAQLPAERPERLRGLGLCVTFARIQLPVLALYASTPSPGINGLFLIVLGTTTTIPLPSPQPRRPQYQAGPLPASRRQHPHPEWLASGRDREFPRPFHSYSLHIVPTLDLPPFSAYPIDPSVT